MRQAGGLAAVLLAAGAPLVLAAQALAEPLNSSVGAKQADAIAQTASVAHRCFFVQSCSDACTA